MARARVTRLMFRSWPCARDCHQNGHDVWCGPDKFHALVLSLRRTNGSIGLACQGWERPTGDASTRLPFEWQARSQFLGNRQKAPTCPGLLVVSAKAL